MSVSTGRLSGFLVALSIGLILFIPLIIYQNLILPSYILPSAAGAGHLGARDAVFQPGLGGFRHGDEHRICQVPVRVPRP